MVLITGATGFLGSHLAAELIAAGQQPVLTFRNTLIIPESLKPVESHCLWRKADLLDVPALEEAFEGVDVVYHCAALVSFDPVDAKEMMKINIEGTANLVNLSLKHQIKKFLYVSSVAAIGEGKGHLASERDVWEQSSKTSRYAFSKFEAQREVWRAEAEGLSVVIVNPSIILGETDWNRGSGQLFKAVKKGLRFYPPGSSGMVGVGDVVKCMTGLMKSAEVGQFIISSENISYLDFFTLVAGYLNKKPPTFELKTWMLNLGWRLSAAFGTGGLTEETAHAAGSLTGYDSLKIVRALNFSFTPLDRIVNDICRKLNQ